MAGDAFVVFGEEGFVCGLLAVVGFGELEGVGEDDAVEGEVVRPFRALWGFGVGTQGVALGYVSLPLWGEEW